MKGFTSGVFFPFQTKDRRAERPPTRGGSLHLCMEQDLLGYALFFKSGSLHVYCDTQGSQTHIYQRKKEHCGILFPKANKLFFSYRHKNCLRRHRSSAYRSIQWMNELRDQIIDQIAYFQEAIRRRTLFLSVLAERLQWSLEILNAQDLKTKK